MRAQRLTTIIFIGMLLGIAVGYACHELWPDPQTAKTIAGYISLFTDIFLRLIKMIIAPLVFTTLVVGVAHMGDTKSVGRIGGKAMLWFVSASLVSLLLGLIMVNILRPGDNLNLPLPDASAATNLNAASLSFKDFVTHLVPKSAVEAMANNEILQIVVFSLFFGVAAASLGERAAGVVRIIDETSHIILTITGYIMFLGRNMFRLISLIREPFLLGFSTASSEAAYPVTMAQLEKLPVSKKIISFVLPMGYSFNLDGSMMYCTFATIFISQAYNLPLSITQQITMLLVLMLTSKGMAGVPRASLVVIAATLVTFNLPEAGLLLIIGIDQFLDMGRTATNVIGNSLATAVIGRWEGETAETIGIPAEAQAA